MPYSTIENLLSDTPPSTAHVHFTDHMKAQIGPFLLKKKIMRIYEGRNIAV